MRSHGPGNGKILAGIIEETLMVDMMKDVYRMMQQGCRQYSNTSLEFVEIPKDDLNEKNLFENPELPMSMDVLVMAFDYSLLSSYENLNITRITKIFLPSYTFLLSPAPEPVINTNLSFIVIEPIVTWLLVFLLFLVTTVMSLAITTRSPLKRCWPRFKNFIQKFKAQLWQNANQFFCEGYLLVPRSLPWRIAFISWLLGVMFLSFEISSNLKSEFSETKYLKVDTIDDLLERAGKIKIGITEGGVPDLLFAKKALTEPKFQRLEEILKGERDIGEKMHAVQLITGEVYEQVANRKLIFISGMFVVFASMSHHYYNQENLFDFKEIYYFSEPVDQSYSAALFTTSFAGTPYSAIVNELMTISTECKLTYPILRPMYFVIEILRWSEPAQLETNQLTLKGAESIIVLYLIGNAIAYFLLATFATLFINFYKN